MSTTTYYCTVPSRVSHVFPEFSVDIVEQTDDDGWITQRGVAIEEAPESLVVESDENGNYVVTDEMTAWVEQVLAKHGFRHYDSDDSRRYDGYTAYDLTKLN